MWLPKFAMAERLADAVVSKHVGNYIHAHPAVSSEDVYSSREVQREIAAEISKGERFRKPAASICEARDRLRLRYGHMNREQVMALEMAWRRRHVGHAADEIASMRETLASYSALEGAEQGRGNYDSLYGQELKILTRKSDGQIIGLFHVEESGKRLTRAQAMAEGFYKENEDGVPDVPFDTWAARFERKKIAS